MKGGMGLTIAVGRITRSKDHPSRAWVLRFRFEGLGFRVQVWGLGI